MHYHFIREKVLQDEIEMQYVKTDDQVMDSSTKGLSTGKFEEFCHKLNMGQRMKVGEEGEC